MSKQYVERPEVLRQIQEVASKVAGRAVEVAILELRVEPEETENQPAKSTRRNSRRRIQDLNRDEFVEQALSIFGGTLIDVREIHEPINEE